MEKSVYVCLNWKLYWILKQWKMIFDWWKIIKKSENTGWIFIIIPRWKSNRLGKNCRKSDKLCQ